MLFQNTPIIHISTGLTFSPLCLTSSGACYERIFFINFCLFRQPNNLYYTLGSMCMDPLDIPKDYYFSNIIIKLLGDEPTGGVRSR